MSEAGQIAANGTIQMVTSKDSLARYREGYASPNGLGVATASSLGSLFSDDFGGGAIDTTRWDVILGGLPAITAGQAVTSLQSGPNGVGGSPVPTFSQGAIGSGISTGITGPTVAASTLTVGMGTTANAEVLLLSRQMFAGKEDILVLLNKSQPLAANSFFIGLVEVDPATGIPLLNPNFANEHTNRGGVEFGLTTTTTAFQAEAVADSSSSKAVSAVGVAGAVLTTTQEYLIEIDSRDIIVSNSAVDSVAAKAVGSVRVSSQCPNDQKMYKLAMRFRNSGGAPASNTNIVISRIIVIDNYEQRVQISTGEGDSIGAKAIAVNLTGAAASLIILGSGSGLIGDVSFQGRATTNGLTETRRVSTADNNAVNIKATAGRLWTGHALNTVATDRYLKFFNKASAPVPGTDTPVFTVKIPASSDVNLTALLGVMGRFFSTGISLCIVAGAADTDNTAIAAGDIILEFGYV